MFIKLVRKHGKWQNLGPGEMKFDRLEKLLGYGQRFQKYRLLESNFGFS